MIKRNFNDKKIITKILKLKKIFLEMNSFFDFLDENRDEDEKGNPIKTN